MREAVIVSTARTGIGRAYKGSLNNTKSPSLAGHVIAESLKRAGIDAAEVEDVVLGTVLSIGTAGMNLARNAALTAGLPVTVPGQTMDRQCASGLMAIATGAKQIMVDGMDIVVAGGHENITAAQKAYFESMSGTFDEALLKISPNAYMPMLQTALWSHSAVQLWHNKMVASIMRLRLSKHIWPLQIKQQVVFLTKKSDLTKTKAIGPIPT